MFTFCLMHNDNNDNQFCLYCCQFTLQITLRLYNFRFMPCCLISRCIDKDIFITGAVMYLTTDLLFGHSEDAQSVHISAFLQFTFIFQHHWSEADNRVFIVIFLSPLQATQVQWDFIRPSCGHCIRHLTSYTQSGL